MPEGIEIEYYRRAAEAVVARTVRSVDVVDAAYLRGGADQVAVEAALVGNRVQASRRRGKLLMLDVGNVTLGLRFGMTGRLIVDGAATIEELEYASKRNDPGWDRFIMRFDTGDLVIRDQRRFGSVELDPDEAALGVDLFDIQGGDLRRVLDTSSRPLKSRLMDQSKLAGLGNLLTDEILWRASLDPARASDSLTVAERRRLLHHLKRVPAELADRGGSHTGDLQGERHADGHCPRDGAELAMSNVGGRTTYSCPKHQVPQDRL